MRAVAAGSPPSIARSSARDRPSLPSSLAVAFTAIGAAAFVILRALAPMHFMGWDEAYYLGIGANLLAGRGLETAFGDVPSIHSPLWPLVLQAPATWLGIDPTAWGHALSVVTGCAVAVLAAWFAWRSIPVAAPFAAAFVLAYPFFVDLAGWMGLDLPAAALTMLYVGLGIAAVRRGSFRLGLVAGLVFAAAFLIKEVALPFAPVPILAGLVRETRIDRLGRGGAGILLAAAAGTSWWFIVYALTVGGVYRLGTPTWTLVPLALGAVALVIVGAMIDRIVPAAARPLSDLAATRASRLGWLLVAAWTLLLTVYFAVAPNPIGTTLLDVTQIRASLLRSIPDHLPLVGWALPGVLVVLIRRWMPRLGRPPSGPIDPDDPLRPRDVHAVDDLLIAIVVGLPLVLLVAVVGEGPRHYVAILGFLAALGAIGWAELLASVARGLRIAPAPLSGAAGVVVVGVAVVAMASYMPAATNATDLARASVVRTTTAWIRQHRAPGSAVVFGQGLVMETGLQLEGDYGLTWIQRDVGVHLDPAAPLGLRSADGARPDDWVALWTEGRDATALFGYRAGPLVDLFRRLGPAIWIETAAVDDRDPAPQLDSLALARGLRELARWSWPVGASRYETVVYEVDPSRLSFAPAIAITAPGLARMITAMERDPAGYRAAASELLGRIDPSTLGPSASGLLQELRTVAER